MIAMALALMLAADPVAVPPQIEAEAAKATDIREIHGPIEVPSRWPWVAVAGALAGAAGIWAWRRKRATPEVSLDPGEQARADLMAARAWIDREQPREYAIAVSDAIRNYLEAAHGLRAPQRTTEEFLAEIQANPGPVPADQLGRFLAACDMAKFARASLGRPEMEDLHRAALDMVES